MKTTVELSDSLLRQARVYAAERGMTLREVIEQGVEAVVSGIAAPRRKFRLKTVVTEGDGLICEDD